MLVIAVGSLVNRIAMYPDIVLGTVSESGSETIDSGFGTGQCNAHDHLVYPIGVNARPGLCIE
jgi:hypothetical protein